MAKEAMQWRARALFAESKLQERKAMTTEDEALCAWLDTFKADGLTEAAARIRALRAALDEWYATRERPLSKADQKLIAAVRAPALGREK